jgi:Arc/MetJ-type ribon-helix-helix transcriptional regulator
MRKTMTISLPPELARSVARKAKKKGVSRSQVIQDLLLELELEERLQAAQAKAEQRARALGLYSDEDVLRFIGVRTA